MTATLSSKPYTQFLQEPYNFVPQRPVQIQIIGYKYLKTTGSTTTVLTPTNGSTAWPPQSDYQQATSGVFTVQIVTQNLSPAQAANLTKAVTSSTFLSGINGEEIMFSLFPTDFIYLFV